MKIIVAEYAVGINDPAYLAEGRAMLMTLVRSFKNTGNDVIYPEDVKDFYRFIEKRSVECDCGLVIAPDEFLYEYTRILEENTTNLGSPSETVKLCADKLSTSFELKKNGIPTPKIYESRGHVQKKKYVVKPRFGCASEDISVTSKFMCKDGFITTEFIQGDHLSVSLVVGTHTLPITINKQIVDFSDKITYKGGVVPYDTASKDDILDTAIKSAEILGCRGYVGIDIVLGDAPYIVDVNTRATTSIVGIDQVLKGEIADLILKAKFGGLQERVKIDGQVSFEVGELGQ